jgi:hypothetical protein
MCIENFEIDFAYRTPIEPLFSFDTTAQEDGDFKVCFNNHMSTWTQKTVWFQVWHITREGAKTGTRLQYKSRRRCKKGAVEVSEVEAGAGAGAGTGTQKTFCFRAGQSFEAENRNSGRSSNRSRCMNKR